jgi:hypothetical protein
MLINVGKLFNSDRPGISSDISPVRADQFTQNNAPILVSFPAVATDLPKLVGQQVAFSEMMDKLSGVEARTT